ncbi:Uma2 family endonuclease [Streptomyces sp. NPDC021224]|uniref:Uma2 family endonuclease n=1 Tax=unclassified Streptomyces TaxID=2593676 RepID=UPI00378D11A1
MSVDAIVHTEFPEGYTVLFGAGGKVIMAPQSFEHSETIKMLQYSTIMSLGLFAKTPSGVYIDFPADEYSAPDLAILREGARREGKRFSFEDVLLISEVVSMSSARKDYDDCTAKYGRYGIPVYMVVDPYAEEVVLHTQPTSTGYIAAHTHKYGTGEVPIDLGDGRTFVLDLDLLARQASESKNH